MLLQPYSILQNHQRSPRMSIGAQLLCFVPTESQLLRFRLFGDRSEEQRIHMASKLQGNAAPCSNLLILPYTDSHLALRLTQYQAPERTCRCSRSKCFLHLLSHRQYSNCNTITATPYTPSLFFRSWVFWSSHSPWHFLLYPSYPYFLCAILHLVAG
jgi:hypothetical protein